ncbi:hypothetical protein EL17_18310 [Anditalea andensis]|uniref:histidine kinase n=2 Tax=Anditalea andensis TaxID=1048983 RepID=A0A074KWW2_9BACT|nr:hypothetical protein EL17_18310 [Anditalea andensis]
MKSSLLLLMMLWAYQIYGQRHNFNISRLTTRDGLSNNHVTDVLEDKMGFIWIGTYDGLNKWNGYDFKIYRKETGNSNSLPGNFILSLEEDNANNIWIGTNNDGLTRYNITEDKFYRYGTVVGDEHSIPGNIIRCIKVDKQNNVWIGTNYGLVKYDPITDTFKRFTFPKGMVYTGTIDVRRILQISDTDLLIQNSLGLYSLNLENELIQKAGYEFPGYHDGLFTKNEPIFFDSNAHLWVGATDGLIRFNTITGESKKYINKENDPGSISSNAFSYIYEDSRKNVWIGTRNRGVNRYNAASENFTVIQEEAYTGKGLTNNIITNIYEDSNANMWFSTQEGGINHFNYKYREFQYYAHNHLDQSSISSNKTGVFQEDEQGNIWIGTKEGGINRYDSDTDAFQRYKLTSKFISPSILGIEVRDNNQLYTAGWDMGLFSFNTKTGEAVNLMDGAKINNKPISLNIKGMKLDTKGNLWLATHEKQGITVYNPAEHKFYNAADPGPYDPQLLGIEYAVSMMEDSKNRLWIISYAGIYMYDTMLHSIKHDPADRNTLGSNYTFDIFEDSGHTVWVGNAGGLDKIIENGRTFTVERYSEKFSLPTNIKGILEDSKGNLWLSANRDIIRFNPVTEKIKQFAIHDVPNQEFYERSRLKSRTGEMFFGGINGFIRFHPDSLVDFKNKSRVYIVDFQLFNKSQTVNGDNSPLVRNILETSQVNLSYDQSVITFEFLGLNYNAFQPLEYAYKMEGFDEDWYFVGEKRFATYTNLPPGKYNFRVHLVENNVLQEAGTFLLLEISPPFWKTGWAYGVYFVLIALTFYLFRKAILYRETLRNEIELEKLEIKNATETNLMKLRFFTNVSHEFRTPLTLIKAPIEKLLSATEDMDREEKNYHYNLIETNTAKLLTLVNQLMDYRKLEAGSLVLETSNGDIVAFCKKTWSIFQVLANKNHITYEFHSEVDSLMMAFDADKLDKIISNLLSNAFKNTHEQGHIKLIIEKHPDGPDGQTGFVHIKVQDDGEGIPKKELKRIFERFYSVPRKDTDVNKGTGIGLALSKELAELHKGEIRVESKKGEGATFTLSIPFAKQKMSNHLLNPITRQIKSETVDREMDHMILGIKPSENPKILILEDDAELRDFLKNELSSGFQVITAVDGEEGLEKAFLEIPHIIISDITMPRMDGVAFCQRIKADHRTSHVPLILLTARHAREKQLEGLTSGADDYILKPFNLEILKLRINNLLHSRKELAEKFKNSQELTFENDQVEDKDKILIQSIIDIVLANLEQEKINADFIAQRVNMSRTLVYLKIEALTGQSVNEFIRNIRLKKAIHLLKESSLNITEIAYTVGFSSQSYFSRSFIKQFGMSPKKFLEIYR